MGAQDDDGPATGELRLAKEDAFEGGRLSLEGEEDSDGFCFRKNSPVVVFGLLSKEALGLWLWSGGHEGLPEMLSGGITGGGVVALCGGVWDPPPKILRKPFILEDCASAKRPESGWNGSICQLK